ncbi:MAG: transporter substrate-binding domain-containing protein [Phycisphaerales bacterium]
MEAARALLPSLPWCVAGLTGPSVWAASPDASALDPTGAGNLHAVHEAVTPTTDASHLLVATTPARQGDLADFMRNGWPIRVAVPYSRTFFWVDPQGVHGMVPALMRGLADHLQRCGPEGCALPTLQFVPMPLDQMEQALEDGRAEIAAGGLVMVPGWERVAAFTCPVLTDVDSGVVRAPHARAVERIEDLSGRTVVVARGRAADDVLAELRPAFQQRQLAPPQVEYAPDRLGMEEVLELVVAGTYEYTVMPRPLVAALARNLPGLEATPVNVAVNQQTACAVRRQMPALVQALNGFIQSSHGRSAPSACWRALRSMEQTLWSTCPIQRTRPAPARQRTPHRLAPAVQSRPPLASVLAYAPLFVKHGRQFACSRCAWQRRRTRKATLIRAPGAAWAPWGSCS